MKVQKEATMGRGGERHKGRIERLRVRLAYGFEARTQHQLSSSWHKGGGDAKKEKRKRTGAHTKSNRQINKAHTHAAGQQRHFASGAPTPSQCGPLLDFSSHNAARSALQRWSSPRRHSTEKHRKTKTNQPTAAKARHKRTKHGAGEATVRFQGLWVFSHGRGVSDICLFMVEHHSVAHHRNNKQTMWGEGVVTRRKTVANTQHTAIQLPRALSRRSVPCLKW